MSFLHFILIVVLFCSAVQARISPKPDDSVYKVVGCVSRRFNTCEIGDIFVLPDEETILSIVYINNAGLWSFASPYLEIMYRNGSTVKLSMEVIGDTNLQCTFGSKL